MLCRVRASTWLLAVLIAGCRPSATIEHTTPVANLQTYRTVGLRVRSSAFASQGIAMYLERAVLQQLQQKCQFDLVGPMGTTPTDVVLDLNITNSARGGGGWVSNSSQATIDTLLVLSDGQNGDLLGTARIHGKSSGMIVNNGPPESEAAEAIAKTVADVFAKSGCSGPRVAKAEPLPQDTTPTTTTPTTTTTTTPGEGSGSATPLPDDKTRATAEALNEQGKDKLRGGDDAGALADFQKANALVPDARYQYNVCLALEAHEQWDNAISACRQARSMSSEPRLVAKIDHRIELLQQHKN